MMKSIVVMYNSMGEALTVFDILTFSFSLSELFFESFPNFLLGCEISVFTYLSVQEVQIPEESEKPAPASDLNRPPSRSSYRGPV